MNWISESERLPEKGEEVLFVHNGVIHIGIFVAKGTYHGCNLWQSSHGFNGVHNATHWMPLPELPKDS
jgi:Protein of unknown function (DUF551)